ncbi:MAG: hypothetical protein ABIF77_08810 [bacterium]
MSKKPRWESIRLHCAEEDRLATLLVEWQQTGGKATIKGISCDNPRLRNFDNWDCGWACWKEVDRTAGQ